MSAKNSRTDGNTRSDEERSASPKGVPPPDPESSRSNGSTGEETSEGTEIPPGLTSALHAGGDIRALSWDDAMLHFGPSRCNGEAHAGSFRVPPPGIKFVHAVPLPLRRIGCMWLDQGDESRRCGRSVSWMMGANPSLARLYCEVHGNIIYKRRLRTTTRRRQRELADMEAAEKTAREDEADCRLAR